MRTFPLFALLGLGIFAGGCADDDELTNRRGCGLTASGGAHWYPAVRLVDTLGRPVCDARVVARDGDFEATLPAEQEGCYFYDMPARSGTYELTIEKGGYVTYVASAVPSDAAAVSCAGPPMIEVSVEPVARDCDAPAALAFQLDVHDKAGASVCDATVVAREGGFSQYLRPTPTGDGTCSWGGPVERPGTYEIRVTKPGYAVAVLEDVVVTADDCHVKTVALEMKLARSSKPLTGG